LTLHKRKKEDYLVVLNLSSEARKLQMNSEKISARSPFLSPKEMVLKRHSRLFQLEKALGYLTVNSMTINKFTGLSMTRPFTGEEWKKAFYFLILTTELIFKRYLRKRWSNLR
jgi:hypothetical protein